MGSELRFIYTRYQNTASRVINALLCYSSCRWPPIGATNSGARPDDRRGAERQGRSAQAVDSSGGSRGRRGEGTLVTPGGGETLERRAWPR